MSEKRGNGRWSYSAGSYGNSVRVFEDASGIIYVAVYDPDTGGETRRSLRHRNRREAIAFAEEMAARMRLGEELRPTKLSLSQAWSEYLRERTPDKTAPSRQHDERVAEMWTRVLGHDFNPERYTRREHDRFIRLRMSGEIDARGRRVADPEKRRSVSARTVERDLSSLKALFRWLVDCRLLRENPMRGLSIPKEENPERALATSDRVDAIREVYCEPRMHVMRDGEQHERESYLPEMFEIVVGTGRRIGAVCALRCEDLDLDETKEAPWGAIVWPEDSDKMGRRWRCPVSRRVRTAVTGALLKRGRGPSGPLFPAPRDPSEPVRYELASAWLREAEKLANLEPQRRTLVARLPPPVGLRPQAPPGQGRGRGRRLEDHVRPAGDLPAARRRDPAPRRDRRCGAAERGVD